MAEKAANARLDKWLWAARFFKTRRLASEAVEGGKVYIAGQKCKPGKKITTGLTISIRQGFSEKTVVVTALSEVRKSAAIARQLYEETAQSIARREQEAVNRRSQPGGQSPGEKPGKKQRRDLVNLKRKQYH